MSTLKGLKPGTCGHLLFCRAAVRASDTEQLQAMQRNQGIIPGGKKVKWKTMITFRKKEHNFEPWRIAYVLYLDYKSGFGLPGTNKQRDT